LFFSGAAIDARGALRRGLTLARQEQFMASRAAEKQNKAEGVRQFYKQVTPTEFCSAAALAFRLRVINSSALLNVSGALIWVP
jgi:hypothetical protein